MDHLIAINGLVLYVRDISISADYYRKLGFEMREDLANQVGTARLGDVLIKFVGAETAQDPSFAAEANAEPKGSGLFIYVQVQDIDRYYLDLVQAGTTPRTTPRDWPWGAREFVVRDPDGYKLVFYEPKAR